MRIKVIHKLSFFCLIGAFGICGLVACNNSGDTKTGDNGMSSDSSNKTGASTDSTVKDSAAVAAQPVKKKRKVSIVFPPAGTDKIAKDKEGVYSRTETMPEFPGGSDALSDYINTHLDYGQTAIDDNTTGTLRISFVVDENGKVMDVHLMGDQKVGGGLDDQAVKVISNMPAWTPGKVKGKNVKTRLELPISFQVES